MAESCAVDKEILVDSMVEEEKEATGKQEFTEMKADGTTSGLNKIWQTRRKWLIVVSVVLLLLFVITGVVMAIALSGLRGKPSCRSNLSGGNYAGSISVTRSGRTCQRWDSQYPHTHSITEDFLPDASLSLAENYCRSPDFDPEGAWCFTMDTETPWEYCDVPACDTVGCLDTPSGENYIGQAALSKTQRTCQKWSRLQLDTQFGMTSYSVAEFAGNDVNHNFCRNPLGKKERPWCHLTGEGDDGGKGWEYCDIPLCERLNVAANVAILPEKMCILQGGFCTTKACCPRDYYIGDLCQDEEKVCCMSKPDCQWAEAERVHSTWPEGSYGLLMSFYGCPLNEAFYWHKGILTLTSSTTPIRGNLTSNVLWFLGPYDDKQVSLNLCLRDESFAPQGEPWPNGSYCIFKYRDLCPQGFQEQTLKVRGEEMTFSSSIKYEEGCGNETHQLCVNFCCREDQSSSQEVILPNQNSFYLLKYGSRCQRIKNMKEQVQVVDVVTGEAGTTNISAGLRHSIGVRMDGFSMEFCHYQSTVPDVCYDSINRGYFYRGIINVTTNGVCSFWSDVPQVARPTFYQYVGLDGNNFCRNVLVSESEHQPWCFANGRKVLCDVPVCAGDWGSYQQVGKGRPVRQKMGGGAEAQLAIDGLKETCSVQILPKAWWQLDLQGLYTVYGVQIYRNNVKQCVIRLANMHVGIEPDDFQNSGAMMCAHNFTIGAPSEVMIKCKQPTLGRYITLENLAYIKYETYNPTYDACLEICEVVAYVRGSGCGRRILERARRDSAQTTISTSDGKRYSGKDLLTLSSPAWCGENSDTHWMKINLLIPYRIQGVETVGETGAVGGQALITSFSLEYGMDDTQLLPYQEYYGITKIFQNDAKMTTPKLHRFIHEISTRFMKINVLSFVYKPCMKIEIIGCLANFVNLLRFGIETQSSTRNSRSADLGADNDLATCSETLVENGTWWQTKLPQPALVHSFFLTTGVANQWNLVARRRTVAISTGFDGHPEHAVDGNTNPIYAEGSCSHTTRANNPWWSVELAAGAEVSTVMITGRGACCPERMNHFSVYVGDVPLVSGTALNRTLYQHCVTSTEPFKLGETKTVHCSEPLQGKYLIIINDRRGYIQICEVQAYGSRVPLLVNLTQQPVQSSHREESSCSHVTEVPVGGLLHSFRCESGEPADYVALSVEGDGLLTVCSASAYGGYPATIVPLTPGKNNIKVTCDQGHQLHLEYYNSTTAHQGSLRVRGEHLAWILHDCERQESCIIPVTQEEEAVTMDTLHLELYCSVVEEADEQESQDQNSRVPSTTPRPAPTTATFLMEWAPPGAGNDSHMFDLCWLDDITLVMSQGMGEQVLTASIDIENKTCQSFRIIDKGYRACRVSCSPDGESFYVTDCTNDRVMVYNRAGKGEVWKPHQLVGKPFTVAVNRDWIIIGTYSPGPVYVYKRDRQFLYKLSFDGVQDSLWCTYLTQQGFFLALTGGSDTLIIRDFNLKTTVTAGGPGHGDGQLDSPRGVAARGNVVLVSDYGSHRTSVFTTGGEFLHQLNFEGGGVTYPRANAVSPTNGLLAIGSYRKVRIFTLRP